MAMFYLGEIVSLKKGPAVWRRLLAVYSSSRMPLNKNPLGGEASTSSVRFSHQRNKFNKFQYVPVNFLRISGALPFKEK